MKEKLHILFALFHFKWLEIKMSFRRGSETLWIITLILSVLIIGPLILAMGVGGFFAGCHMGQASVEFFNWKWVIFGFYGLAFMAYLFANFAQPIRVGQLPYRRLVQYPISIRSFYWMNLLSSVLDISFLVFLPAYFTVLLGQLLGGAGLAGVLAGFLATLFFIVGLLAWGQVVIVLMENLTSDRKRREWIMFLVPVVSILVYFAMTGVTRGLVKEQWGDFSIGRLESLALLIPPGWMAHILLGGQEEILHWPHLGLLFLFALLGERIGYRMTFNQLYQKEKGPGRSKGMNQAGLSDKKLTAGWSLPGFSQQRISLLEKEWKYLIRSSQGRFAFFWPVLFGVIMFFLPGRESLLMELAGGAGKFSLIPFTGFILLFFLPFYVNLFGFDHGGTRLYFLSPATLREVLLAKNLAILFFGSIILVESVLVVMLVVGVLSLTGILHAFLCLSFGLLLLFCLGNYLSCWFPKPLRMMALGRNNPSQMSTFGAFLMMAFISLLIAFTTLVGVFTSWWVALGVDLFLVLAGIFLYWTVGLNGALRQYEMRQEKFLEQAAREKPME